MKRLSLALMSLTMALCMCLGLAACNTVGKDDNLYITLDTKAVIKEFDVGDEFNCDGLVVTAHYGDENEVVEDYAVKTPDMSTAGVKDVVINYNGAKSQYAITVNKAVEVNGDVAELAAPVVKYVYDSNAVSVKGAKTLDGGALEFTAQAAKGYKLAEITATVGGAEYAVAGGNGEYVIDAEALTDNAIVTIAAEPDDYEIATYKVEYYAQDGKTILAKVGYDSLEERLYQPEAETYYTFDGWYNNGEKVQSLTDVFKGDVAPAELIGKWTLNAEKVDELQNSINIEVTGEEGNITVKVLINEPDDVWATLIGELEEHNGEINGLGIIQAIEKSAVFENLTDTYSALKGLPEVSGGASGARLENPVANENGNAYLHVYHWGNVYGTLTTTFRISVDKGPRYFTPCLIVSDGESDPVFLKSAAQDQVVKTRLDFPEGYKTWHLTRSSDDGNIDYPWEMFTKSEGKYDEIDIYIYDINAVDYPEGTDYKTFDFLNGAEPFAIYTIKNEGWVKWSSIKAEIMEAWKKIPKEEREDAYDFIFAMRVSPNDSSKDEYIDSLLNYAVTREDEHVRDTKNIALAVPAPNTPQLRFTGDGNTFEFLREGGNGSVFTTYKAAAVEIEIKKGTQQFTAYLLIDGTDLYISSTPTLDTSKALKVIGGVGNAYIGVDEVNKWVAEHYPDISDFNAKAWEYKTKIIVGEDSVWTADGDWSEVINKALTEAPADAQLRIDSAGNALEFLRDGIKSLVFTEYKAAYIAIEFSIVTDNGEGEYNRTTNTAYLFNENGQACLYRDVNKGGTVKQCDGGIGNAYLYVSAFNEWVASEYGLENFNALLCEYKTQICVNDDSTWTADGDWSDVVYFNGFTKDVAPRFPQIRVTSGAVEFVRTGGAGKLFTDYNAAYVEIQMRKDGVTRTFYLFNEDGKAMLYSSVEKEDEGKECNGGIGDAYLYAADFNTWVEKAFSEDSFNATEWQFRTKVHVDENSTWNEDGYWSDWVSST